MGFFRFLLIRSYLINQPFKTLRTHTFIDLFIFRLKFWVVLIVVPVSPLAEITVALLSLLIFDICTFKIINTSHLFTWGFMSFILPLTPQRQLRDNREMWEEHCEKTQIKLKFASRKTSKGLGPWQPKAFLSRSELDPTIILDIPNSRGQRSERWPGNWAESAALCTQEWSIFVCRSSLVLYSFSLDRTDHQSDSFLPNAD